MTKKKKIEKPSDFDVLRCVIEQIKGGKHKYTPSTITYYKNGKWITIDCKDFSKGKY